MRLLKNIFKKILPVRRVVAKCGHKTELEGRISAFGQSCYVELKRDKDGAVYYCLKCIEKMTIRCAWCGKPIFIGQLITLYPRNNDSEIPDYAVVYKKNPRLLVGCLRWNCADTGGDRMGFWVPPGEVYRVMSPIEAAFLTKKPVIVNDFSDLEEAEQLHDELIKNKVSDN